MNGKMLVGKIVNTHGLKGHLKVYPYTTDKEEFDAFEYLMLEGSDKKLGIKSVRYQKNMAVILFEGYDNINDAEKLKNKDVYINRADLGDMDEDTFIYSEIEGYAVEDETHGSVGVIKSVTSGAAQDLIVVEKPDGSTFMIPSVKEFVKGFDHEARVLRVNLIEGIM